MRAATFGVLMIAGAIVGSSGCGGSGGGTPAGAAGSSATGAAGSTGAAGTTGAAGSTGAAGTSGPGAAGASGVAVVSLAQLPAQWAQTVCAQNFKCATVSDQMMRTMQDCLDSNRSIWMVLAGSVQDGQSKGRVAYDPAAMAACLDALAGESCAAWVTGLAHDIACPEAFTGRVATGGACQSDVECVMGFCDGADLSTTPPTDGMCKPRVAHGGMCTIADACVALDYCDAATKMCAAKKAGGTACTIDDECSNACNHDTSKCSGYAGCNVGAITTSSTLLSLLALGLIVRLARRRR